jgi:hypothetical protein
MKKVFLIGTPRSGTTFFAKCLSKAGVYIGKETDFAEDLRVCEWHQKLIKSWVDPIKKNLDVTPEIIHKQEDIQDAFIRDAEKEGKAVWGWKEPRGLLIFHLWYSHMDDDSRLLVTFRHPQEFADGCAEQWGPGKQWQRSVLLPESTVEHETVWFLDLWIKHWAVFFENWKYQIKSNPSLEQNTRFLFFSKDYMSENDFIFKEVCRELNLTKVLPSESFKLEGDSGKHNNYPSEDIENNIPEACRPIWIQLIRLFEKQIKGAI